MDLDCDGVIPPNEMQFIGLRNVLKTSSVAEMCSFTLICRQRERWRFLTLMNAKYLETLSISTSSLHLRLVICQAREETTLTEWDGFAHMEYIRLSMEEDGQDASKREYKSSTLVLASVTEISDASLDDIHN